MPAGHPPDAEANDAPALRFAATDPAAVRTYGAAAAAIAAGLVAWRLLAPVMGEQSAYLVFGAAILCTARWAGAGPALAATGLAAMLCLLLQARLLGIATLWSPAHWFVTALFAGFGAMIARWVPAPAGGNGRQEPPPASKEIAKPQAFAALAPAVVPVSAVAASAVRDGALRGDLLPLAALAATAGDGPDRRRQLVAALAHATGARDAAFWRRVPSGARLRGETYRVSTRSWHDGPDLSAGEAPAFFAALRTAVGWRVADAAADRSELAALRLAGSWLAVPVRGAAGEPLGLCCVADAAGRNWTDAEHAATLATAALLGLAAGVTAETPAAAPLAATPSAVAARLVAEAAEAFHRPGAPVPPADDLDDGDAESDEETEEADDEEAEIDDLADDEDAEAEDCETETDEETEPAVDGPEADEEESEHDDQGADAAEHRDHEELAAADPAACGNGDADEETDRPPARGRALLIETNKIHQRALRAGLAEAGWELAIAEDPATAAKLWATGRYQAAFANASVPGGLARLAERLASAAPAGARPKLVALGVAAAPAGFDGAVSRPLDLAALRRWLSETTPAAATDRHAAWEAALQQLAEGGGAAALARLRQLAGEHPPGKLREFLNKAERRLQAGRPEQVAELASRWGSRLRRALRSAVPAGGTAADADA